MKKIDGGVAKASISVLKLVRTIQPIGKNRISPTAQPRMVTPTVCRMLRFAMAQPPFFRVRAKARTRKKATMLARITATTPPAEALPTLNCCRPFR